MKHFGPVVTDDCRRFDQELHVRFPKSTGQVANLLGVPEPRINDIIRRGKFRPIPEVIAGRRAWLQQHLAALASFLGIALPKCADAGSESAR